MFQKLSIFAAFKSTLEFANAIMVTRQVSLYSCLDPLGHSLFINVVSESAKRRTKYNNALMIVHIYFQIHDMALTLCILKFAFLSYSIPICSIFHLLATFIHRYINTIKQSFNKSKLSKHYIQIYRKFRPKTILSYLSCLSCICRNDWTFSAF